MDTVNVHSDYSVTATEFINFLSVIMAQRIKQVFQNTYLPPVNKKSKPKSIQTLILLNRLLNIFLK